MLKKAKKLVSKFAQDFIIKRNRKKVIFVIINNLLIEMLAIYKILR